MWCKHPNADLAGLVSRRSGQSISDVSTSHPSSTGTGTPVYDHLLSRPPPRIGPYRIVRELRRGGMGAVYLGEAVDGEAVAVKLAMQSDEHTRARFAQEVRATRGLDHPHIVRVLADGVAEERPWYAMAYVGAVNLADVLAVRGAEAPADLPSLVQWVQLDDPPVLESADRRGLPSSSSLNLLIAVARAVAHAHSRGVLHRDLKPANILLSDEGQALLADFGVARHLESALRLTAVDEVVGTYRYIAPEQLAGEEIDERADVYGLGAILYECLTGQPPPRRRHGCERLPLPKTVPATLRGIVYAALEPQPARRLPSALALASELRRFVSGDPVTARGPGRWRCLIYWSHRHLFLSALCLALLLIGGLLLLVRQEIAQRQTVSWQELGTWHAGSIPLQHDAPDTWQPRLLGTTGHTYGAGVLAGRWRPNPSDIGLLAQTPTDAWQGHVAYGIVGPGTGGRRVALTATAPADGRGELSVFLDARERFDDGYTFQFGAYENSCSILKEDGVILWIGPGQAEAGRRYHIALERLEDSVRATVDGRAVVTVERELPLAGPLAGFFTYLHRGTVGPVVERVGLHRAQVPDLVPPDRSLVRLAQIARNLSGPAREHCLHAGLDLSVDLLARLPIVDDRSDQVLLRRGALLQLAGATLPFEHEAALLRRHESLHMRLAFHQQHVLRTTGRTERHEAVTIALLELPHDRHSPFIAWFERHYGDSLDADFGRQLLEHLPADDPARHFFQQRMLDHLLLHDPSQRFAWLSELAEQPISSWWQRRATSDRQLWELFRRDLRAADRRQVNQLIDGLDQSMRLVSDDAIRLRLMLLGGPPVRPADLTVEARSELQQILACLDGAADPPRSYQQTTTAGPPPDALQQARQALATDLSLAERLRRSQALTGLLALTPDTVQHRWAAQLAAVLMLDLLVRDPPQAAVLADCSRQSLIHPPAVALPLALAIAAVTNPGRARLRQPAAEKRSAVDAALDAALGELPATPPTALGDDTPPAWLGPLTEWMLIVRLRLAERGVEARQRALRLAELHPRHPAGIAATALLRSRP